MVASRSAWKSPNIATGTRTALSTGWIRTGIVILRWWHAEKNEQGEVKNFSDARGKYEIVSVKGHNTMTSDRPLGTVTYRPTPLRPTHDSLLTPEPLPAWLTQFRAHQVIATNAITRAYADGYRWVILNAPTGSGKTCIGELVRRVGQFRKTLYTCTTKSLQDQQVMDYPYARVLKGRSNYPTLDYPDKFRDRYDPINAGDCMKARVSLPACDGCPTVNDEDEGLHCGFCHPWVNCPYERAKNSALSAPLATINTAYYIAECNGPGRFARYDPLKGIDDRRDLVIVDECDTLESILMSAVEVNISESRQKKLKLSPPEKKTVESAWVEWVNDEAIPAVERALAKLPAHPRETKQIREQKYLDNLHGKLARLKRELGEGNWVYDGYRRDGTGDIIFRPVRVDGVAREMMWPHAKRFLLMSGTIIDPTELTESLGIPDGEWTLVNVPAVFPKENRPVYVCPVASMTKKNENEARPVMAKVIAKVLDHHVDERVLVHTVSYNLARYLYDALEKSYGDRLLVYGSARDRDEVLGKYKEREGSVLLAASMDRGIDLPDDLARVVVVAKVPFGNLGDKQVAARLYGKQGQLWYVVNTIRSLVQMTGRGVRHEEDTCTNYLLDRQFLDNIWAKYKSLLPGWWREALRFDVPGFML